MITQYDLITRKHISSKGCSSGRHGAKEVMSHPWFSSSINWRRLKAGKDKPPFVPDPHAVYAKGNYGFISSIELGCSKKFGKITR